MECSELPGPAAAGVIDDNIWIGCRSIIIGGIMVAKGAVVAASAIVARKEVARE